MVVHFFAPTQVQGWLKSDNQRPMNVGQTTPTSAPLDTVEALLAQQRVAQEQLSRDLQAARTEQAAGPLNAPSFVLRGPQAWVALSALMLLFIVAIVFVKVVQPRLRGLQRLRLQEQARAEAMFVEHASLGDGYSRGVLNDALAAHREAALAPKTAQDVHIDLDLDLSLGWDVSEAASDVTFEPTRALTDEPAQEPHIHLLTNSQLSPLSPLSQQTSADDASNFVSAEVKKVQQSLAEKRLARQPNFMQLPTQTAAAFAPEPALVQAPLFEFALEDLPQPALVLEPESASLASQSAPLEAHWQIQFDLAKEYVGMGLMQEAAMLYADLVAQGEPDVARRADALLSALSQSR